MQVEPVSVAPVLVLYPLALVVPVLALQALELPVFCFYVYGIVIDEDQLVPDLFSTDV